MLSEYVSICGGYMEEAVFGLRLKCRTRVPLQERRPAEHRQRDFSPIRETSDVHTLQTPYICKSKLKCKNMSILNT